MWTGLRRFAAAANGPACVALPTAALPPADHSCFWTFPTKSQPQGYASVTPLALTPGHACLLGSIASCAPRLVSLSVSGKVELPGPTLAALLGGPLSGLRALALDVHFCGCGSGALDGLRGMTDLEALVLRHRGAGKVPLSLAQLPPSLTSLALKKALLTLEDDGADARWQQQQRRGAAAADGAQGQAQEGPSEQGEATLGATGRPPATAEPVSSSSSGSSGGEGGGGAAHAAALPPRPPSRQGGGPAPRPAPVALAPPRGGDDGGAAAGPSHAVTSPQFVRAVALGNISTPDMARLAAPNPAFSGGARGSGGVISGRAAAGGASPRGSQAVAGPASTSGCGVGDGVGDKRGQPAAEELAPCLARLRALFLHTCLTQACVAGCVAGVSSQLTQLAVVGPDVGAGEEQEAWLAEVAAGRLRGVQRCGAGSG
ncbi:hypothetical protein MNEG_16376 [Monoraphidium neglectum]|uniref:Uncharacterized protein n=1 Tax=Monoraphidium neglectum TaxID=145388 RepID=A0A0D2K611_9CHLO|nr:hypothetical protein MNEG_16376 [Monoraphidium neglectum]KIY91588.1 hypothetical protein MNEG_16376 [Monoraphidium neglectum]|eukprot:XP_013890608.1 hypothetical protein MNEG_16376 [Monoraphidium neglectum]